MTASYAEIGRVDNLETCFQQVLFVHFFFLKFLQYFCKTPTIKSVKNSKKYYYFFFVFRYQELNWYNTRGRSENFVFPRECLTMLPTHNFFFNGTRDRNSLPSDILVWP